MKPASNFGSRITNPDRAPLPRQGSVLVCVILCLGIVMSLLLTLAQSSRLTRQQVRREALTRQADWLVQSGYERALARLAADDAYTGETWAVEAHELQGRGAAQVEMQVVTSADGSRRIQVHAQFPADTVHSVRRTQTFFVP